MELLQLGRKSRKLGLTIKKNLHRDEYGMDDMDEFFADDTQSQIMLREQEDRVLRQGEVYKSPTSYNVTTKRSSGVMGGVGVNRGGSDGVHLHSDLHQELEAVPAYDAEFELEDIGNDYELDKEDQSPFNYVARKIDFDNGDEVRDKSTSGPNQATGANKQSPLRSPLPEQRQATSIGGSRGTSIIEEDDDYDYAQQDNNDFYQDEGELFQEESQVIDPILGKQNQRNSRLISPPLTFESDSLHSIRDTRSSRRTRQRNKRRSSFLELEDSTQPSVSEFLADTKDTDEDEEEEVSDVAASTTTELFVLSSSSSTEPGQSQIKKRTTRSRKSRNTRNVSPTYITEVPTLPSPPPEGLRRSKRIRVKPLAFWRNERIIFTKPHQKRPDEEDDEDDEDDEPDMTIVRDVHKLPLRSIAEVVHVPDTIQILTTRQNRRSRKRKPMDAPISPISSDEHEQEDHNRLSADIPGASWLKDKVLKVDVPENGQFVERSIAFSSQYGDFQARTIVSDDGTTSEDPNLRIATLFNDALENCAVGMIELSGVKPPLKIAFSTYYLLIVKGIVEITFNEETFVANKGCNVCIPLGNQYGLKNLGKEAALIHFVQVRKSEVEHDYDYDDEEDVSGVLAS